MQDSNQRGSLSKIGKNDGNLRPMAKVVAAVIRQILVAVFDKAHAGENQSLK